MTGRGIVAVVSGVVLGVVLGATACGSKSPGPASPTPPANQADTDHSSAPPPANTTGPRACPDGQIRVPGGTAQNGIGETVQLGAEHCAPLPAACNGVATCACVDSLCPLGGCVSVDNGNLLCVAG